MSEFVANGTLMGMPITGVNRYFATTSTAAAFTSAFHGTTNFINNAWENDPNKFQQLGAEAGAFLGEGAGVIAAGVFGLQHLRAAGIKAFGFEGTNEGMHLNGTTYQKLAGEKGFQAVGTTGKAGFLSKEAMKAAAQVEDKGLRPFRVNVRGGMPYKGGLSSLRGTYRPMGMGTQALLLMGVPLAVGLIGRATMGLAGKVLDSAYNDNKHFRTPTYDNRYFNTQRYDQSAYQQLGAAMDSYENRMMSVSRIYHSRG